MPTHPWVHWGWLMVGGTALAQEEVQVETSTPENPETTVIVSPLDPALIEFLAEFEGHALELSGASFNERDTGSVRIHSCTAQRC